MQNPITIPAQQLPIDAQRLQHAGSLVARAAATASDESTDHLSWSERDRIARQLALTIIRSFAKPEPALVASCLDCESVELAERIAAGDCPTCAYAFAVAH